MSSVSALCNTVMRGVVDTGVVTHANLDAAVEIIRAEVKALILPERDSAGEYTDARAAVLAGTIHDGWVVRLVVVNCAAKIRAA